MKAKDYKGVIDVLGIELAGLLEDYIKSRGDTISMKDFIKNCVANGMGIRHISEHYEKIEEEKNEVVE